MPIQVLRVIRDMSDRGGLRSRRCTYYCPEAEAPASSWWKPNTDILESEQQVKIRVELAGVARENVNIELKGGRLIISGVRAERRPEERIYYHQLELQYGHFLRVIALPESVVHNEITATLEDGVLQVVISKDERAVEIPISSIEPDE
ncbi:MAG TPA: Hsp20/alpha crystallin family protein [bacterium]|nr:Hsp20/alpha crystallin family protein [bacterium]